MHKYLHIEQCNSYYSVIIPGLQPGAAQHRQCPGGAEEVAQRRGR